MKSARLLLFLISLPLLASLPAYAEPDPSQSAPASPASEIPNLPPKPSAPEPFQNPDINTYLQNYESMADAYIAAVETPPRQRDAEVRKVVAQIDAVASQYAAIRDLLKSDAPDELARFDDYIRAQCDRISAATSHYLKFKK